MTAGLYNDWTGTQTGAPVNGTTEGLLANGAPVMPGAGLGSWQGIGQFTANQLLQNGTSAVLNKALGQGGSLGDAVQNSLANAFAAAGFNLVGNTGIPDGTPAKIALHALMGGLVAEAAGGDFRTGALAAGVNEALVDSLAQQYADMPKDKRDGLLVMNSQLIGLLAAATEPNADAGSLQTGAWVSGNATQYNHDQHDHNPVKEATDEIKEELHEKDHSPVATEDGDSLVTDPTPGIGIGYGKGSGGVAAPKGTVDNITAGGEQLPSTGGKTTQFQKVGGFDQANSDFDSLGLSNIREINMPSGGSGRVGELPDGTRVVVRSGSSENRPGFSSQPTLEIQYSNGPTKIRY